MRLERITVQNFLGVPDFRHATTSPFVLVAGGNARGKTSLQDAIRFCLTGELARGLKLVKDRAQLLTEGSAAGFVELQVDGFTSRRNIGSGKLAGDEPEWSAALALCLDPPRFAQLPEEERRRWLFDLANVRVDRQLVAAELAEGGVSEASIERVLPSLRGGFPAAADFARTEAVKARAEWKGITGEAYGSQKAENWTPAGAAEAPDPAQLDEARERLAQATAKVGALREAKGRADAALPAEKVADLRALADKLPDLRDRLAWAEAEYATANDTRANLERQQRAAQAQPDTQDCPRCRQPLVVHVDRSLGLPGGAMPKAPKAAEVAAAKKAYEAAHNTLLGAREAVRNAEAAELTLANLPEASAEDRAAAAQLPEAQEHVRIYGDTLRLLEADERSAEERSGKATRAAEAHARAVEWVKAEELLGPDGIPAKLLARALDPINDLLAAQAARAGFRPARVERDLTLTYNGRLLALCSESEQWRAHALFAAVIAILSECRIVMLDRFDVIEPADRLGVIDWLASLLTDGTLATVLLAGTLKAKPELDGIDVVWLGEDAHG